MRIGFFGNVNNYPFRLACALKRLGHDVVFVVSSEVPLDRPENQDRKLSGSYPDWIHDFSPRWKTVLPTPWRSRCIRLLQSCDAVVLNQIGPSLLPDIGRPAIAILTGSDLEYFANPESLRQLWREANSFKGALILPVKALLLPGIIRRQREGIRQTAKVVFIPRGFYKEADRLLEELGVGPEKRFFLQLGDTERVQYCGPPSNAVLRVFCATRFNWKLPIPAGYCDLDYKGSDVMIRGLGLYYRETGQRLDIHLVRKGLHVPETVDLVREEGISHLVTWHDEMDQAEVFEQFKLADLVFEQFGQSMIGMAGLDAMATGRPVIGNCNPEFMEQSTGVRMPICQAKTPEEVSAQLKRLIPDAMERRRIGLVSRAYVEKYHSAETAAKVYLEIFEKLIKEERRASVS